MEEKVNVGGLNTTFQRIPVNYANSFNLEEEIIWMPSIRSYWILLVVYLSGKIKYFTSYLTIGFKKMMLSIALIS